MSINYKTYNQNLPAIRCYHCNKALSKYFEEVISSSSMDKFFESHKQIDRYCCKIVLLNDFIIYQELKKKPQVEINNHSILSQKDLKLEKKKK
jgi:DNA-directed RNA polymerase subunit N (RpoN/RPB10)